MPARTPPQIFQHHAEALGAEDIDGIAADYSDDAFFMTPAEVQRGKAEIRHAFTKLLSDIPQAKWNLKTQLYENSGTRLLPHCKKCFRAAVRPSVRSANDFRYWHKADILVTLSNVRFRG
jgi:hypothetical protein